MTTPEVPRAEQEISRSEANYIKISFSRMDLRPGDVVRVSDPDGRYNWSYPGSSSTRGDCQSAGGNPSSS